MAGGVSTYIYPVQGKVTMYLAPIGIIHRTDGVKNVSEQPGIVVLK